MSISVPDMLREHGEQVLQMLTEALQQWLDAPPKLIESILYSFSAGGKRLRPALILESFRALSAGESDKPHRSALAVAVAMELIHTFSLVHDDLPAMDDDDFRRGKPTNHKVYGEAVAILAGDAMMNMAFETIANKAEPDLVAPLIRELAHAAGPSGMVGGQVLDLQSEGQMLDLNGLQQIHRMKTGALLTASCRLGAICARADEKTLAAMTAFGQHMGLSFQIVDDLLDETATPEQLGKATNKDRSRGKNTYPGLLGIEKAQHEAHAQLEAALHAILPLGERANRLSAIARFVVERTV